MNSNRGTYEKLEMSLTHRKQSAGLVSNRGNCRFSCSNLQFRTQLAAQKFRAPLQRISSIHKIVFPKPDCLTISSKQSHIARSRDAKFLIGQKTPSRKQLTCRKQITSRFLIGTEMRFFHNPQLPARHWSLGTRHCLRLIGTEMRFFQFHDSAPLIRRGLRVC
jgi:hypothetical protein